MLKSVEIGTWSSGSCKLEDLIPAALDCLASLDAQMADVPQAEWDAMDSLVVDGEEGSWLYEEIVDAINERLPQYLTYGGHCGDPADVGVWIDWDSMEEDRRSGELPSGDQLPEIASGCFLVVSDHGNAEFYAADEHGKWISLWSCV